MVRPQGQRRAPRRRSAGIAWLLLSTVVLVVLGFGSGIVVGALWERPEQVLAPFRDGHQPVRLAEVLAHPGGTTDAPEVAATLEDAPEPAPGSALESAPGAAPEVSALPAGEPTTPPVAAAPPAAGPWSVQVGSFPEPVPAWKLAERLGEQGYEVHVDEGDAAGTARWRVRAGPVATQAEAERLARRLASQQLDTWVVDEGAAR
jgi:cell division septation protein DedD